MARIVLSKGNITLTEMTLSTERLVIGRRLHCDIRIDDLAISGEHAVIVTSDNDSFLEDLNSTNGTQVNGQPVRKHFLQDQDVIEFAQYRLRYLAEDAKGELLTNDAVPASSLSSIRPAKIFIVSGINAGREIRLTKTLTTIGRPGAEVAAIARRGNNYHVFCIGKTHLTVNGSMVVSMQHRLQHGDVIELVDTKLRFLLL